MEHLDSHHDKKKSLQNNLAIPIAIVIAGGMIATALYFGPSKNSTVVGNNQAPQVAARQAPAQVGTVKPVDFATDHIRGDKNAKVFVIEYSDFECPFCKRFHPTMQQLFDQYQGKVAWVYRHFPLSFHPNAEKEAEASECASEQGGNDVFWKYTDKIFERTTSNGKGFALEDLAPLAKEIGLDDAKFKSCLNSGKYAKHVQQDEQEGQTAGITGTPGNIIWTKDGKTQLISGAVPLSSLTSAIDQILK